MIDLDWHAIRPLNGAKSSGFEELCAQIARSISPERSKFIRKGTPDGGVECYTILSDDTEWGWQAKYFDKIEDSQWTQIDKSVLTALDKHPNLTKYYICIPLNRPDARIKNRQSCMERWIEHEKKWIAKAKTLGMNVEYVWWGSSELVGLLSEPNRAGSVSFWFNTLYFSDAWFKAHLNESLKSAGPRYTQELNIDLPIQKDLEVFDRNKSFLNKVKKQKRIIQERLQFFRHSISELKFSDITAFSGSVFSCVDSINECISTLSDQPTEEMPFHELIELVNNTIECAIILRNLLKNKECEETESNTGNDSVSLRNYTTSKFQIALYHVKEFISALYEAKSIFEHGNMFYNSHLILLTGKAGTGKTHLLCDVARLRIEAGRPTLLLMGQRFLGTTDPWTQALEQLDLRKYSVEQLIGALETVAQCANCRAMVLVDALNEGAGRNIWPVQLPAFLAKVLHSPWISVILSVRSSYEELVIPESVRSQSTKLIHFGFANHEYNATKSFFLHYGLEFPSTPLLSPEFSNPLFLKTLCIGLKSSGQHHLPRGFHGISKIFELYLTAINNGLSQKLDYNPKTPLVTEALNSFSLALVESDKRWLSMSQAVDIIDSHLPSRGFENSLYRGLVTEGIFIEDSILSETRNCGDHEDIVSISYDRLADHLIARHLLDTHIDINSPEKAFATDGALAFLYNNTRYVPAGLLEAMCIQLPERTNKELISLAPKLIEISNFSEAFRQSLIWRSMTAFSNETVDTLQNFIRTEYDLHETLDVLLTVASLPGHPLNAEFLDKRLSKDTMPERDIWWSTYLHEAWNSRGAVDRIVDWAISIDAATELDNDTTSLCAIALTWMLTTSNRFLRDRATKALVCLLTDRNDILISLLDRFKEVNDLYVLERLHAVTYGVAMRSHDAKSVGHLAMKVYELIFSTVTPPAHILLRDYARGTIERAIYLGAKICIDESHIRPPYSSQFPVIPSESEILALHPELENQIIDSVIDGDFACYIIGTNSSHSHWLSIPLTDPCWLSPDERLNVFIDSLSIEKKIAYDFYCNAQNNVNQINFKNISGLADVIENNPALLENKSFIEISYNRDKEIVQANIALIDAEAKLISTLTKENKKQLDNLQVAQDDHKQNVPLYFDLELIQRYVLWRVLNLGWTNERFGDFDHFLASQDRSASKAERIGKKYQWIAYHEIMAYVADNYQFYEEHDYEYIHHYDGPWQLRLRDIDPSCILRSTPGGTKWTGHTPAWWGNVVYSNWGTDSKEWVVQEVDLPSVEELIRVENPDDNISWLNLNGYFDWKSPVPADKERIDIERQELWYMFNAYFIQKTDLALFMDWANQNSFSGRWMPESQSEYTMFFGEHGWSPASRYLDKSGWHTVDRNCPVKIRFASIEYLEEASSFDCSMDDSFTLRMPDKLLMEEMGIKWTYNAADFKDAQGRLVCWDPTAYRAGPTALLIRENSLREYLDREDIAIVWAVFGEKRALGPGTSPKFIGELSISGAYTLNDKGLTGFTKYTKRLPKDSS